MIRLTLLIALAAGAAIAGDVTGTSDVTGTWKAHARTETGREYDVRIDLAVRDGKITGAITASEGSAPIVDARLDGAELSFRVEVSEGAYAVKLTLAGNEMTGGYNGPRGEKGKITARR